jgi:phosphate transport system protein
MSLHFAREIDRIKSQILALGGQVEECVRHAVQSLFEKNAELAEKVIKGDREIDYQEVEVEESCLKLLALYQPVAVDLRFIVSVLKINNDLERIGDLGVNIARRTLFLSGEGADYAVPDQLPQMAAKTRLMLRDSLDSLVKHDALLARRVLANDQEIDALNREVFEVVRKRLEAGATNVAVEMHLHSAARFLERLADHTTNIAEDVIYLIEGVIIRHAAKKAREQLERKESTGRIPPR